MTIFTEYIKLTKQYQDEYGPKTVVLYQVGTFYEMYSIDNSLINLKEITEILNGIQITRRNKSNPNINESNYNLAGIPVLAVNKYLKLLLDANYTIVIMDECDNDKKVRKVSEIISPGTKINDVNPSTTNMLLVIMIEEYKERKNNQINIAVGISFLDLTSGKSYIGEIYSNKKDPLFALDELYKFILIYSPKEVIIISENTLTITTFSELIIKLELTDIYVNNKLEQLPEEMTNISYQNKILQKVFPDHSFYTPHEYLSLENKPLATIAFIYTLNYCYKHNEQILNNIMQPNELASKNNSCSLAYNSSNQLGINNLQNILNKCKTAIGRRSFKERFMIPLINVEELNKQYELVDLFIELFKCKDKQKILINKLENIYDIERIYRFICLKKLNPNNLKQIIDTINSIQCLIKLIPEIKLVYLIDDLYNEIISIIDLENISTENIFIKGAFPEIDKLQTDLITNKDIFNKLIKKLNNIVNKNNNSDINYFKVDYTDRDGYYLEITRCRYKNIEKLLINENIKFGEINIKWTDFSVYHNKNTYKLTCPQLQSINNKIEEIQLLLLENIKNRYNDFLEKIGNKYKEVFLDMTKYISNIDWLYSCAKNAIENCYIKPIIKDINKGKSYIDAKELRHPIVEKIRIFEKYVPNDIQLNCNNNGILLYGVNSSGKSCLGKSVALSIIMAQVGMFVPASTFTYYPYNEIFTRIPTGDDLMKGYSTFIVELIELKKILTRITSNSLVIGDELCSGSEEISALSIVGAGIKELCKKNTSFIFATHLHKLTELNIINKLIEDKLLQIFHLSVEYDSNNDYLIYHRKLLEGSGSSLYGLEVCKSIIKDIEFLNTAESIRNDVLQKPENICINKKSRYNSKVYLDYCEICKNKIANETHHIEEQKLANSTGHIKHIHKNNFANLIAICNKCHDLIHSKKIQTDGFQQTTNGIKLNVIYSDV
jgi:DNA mismatch repair protein MutS